MLRLQAVVLVVSGDFGIRCPFSFPPADIEKLRKADAAKKTTSFPGSTSKMQWLDFMLSFGLPPDEFGKLFYVDQRLDISLFLTLFYSLVISLALFLSLFMSFFL